MQQFCCMVAGLQLLALCQGELISPLALAEEISSGQPSVAYFGLPKPSKHESPELVKENSEHETLTPAALGDTHAQNFYNNPAPPTLPTTHKANSHASVSYIGMPAPGQRPASSFSDNPAPRLSHAAAAMFASEDEEPDLRPYATGGFTGLAPLDETGGAGASKGFDPSKVQFLGFGNQGKQKPHKHHRSKKKFKNWEKAIVLDKYHTHIPTRIPTTKPTPRTTARPTPQPTPSPVPLAPVGGGKRTKICGATTDPLTTFWKLHGTGGLYFDISTMHCKFPKTPTYIFNVVGDKGHWQLAGTSSVSRPSDSGFRIIVLHPSIRADSLLSAATKYKWVVSWIGNIGSNAGQTTAGDTGWDMSPKGSLFVDVSTANSAFSSTPRYFTAIHGREKHWRTEGAHIVYFPKPHSFRIYLVVDECAFGVCVDKGVTPQDAENYHWTIGWIGTSSKTSADAHWYFVRNSNGKDASGTTDLNWLKAKEGKALFMDVDTSSNSFDDDPTYVTSCTTAHIHWRVSGAASIYNPQKTGFRLYLDKATHVRTAKFYKWRINYLGYDGPVDCIVAEKWEPWSKCTKTCNIGTQHRTRQVIQKPGNDGRSCPKTHHTRKCNIAKCPAIDCKVSGWGTWTDCTKSCDEGTQKRTRKVVMLPKSGIQYMRNGKACPILKDSRLCGEEKCPVDCIVSGWSAWTACFSPPTATCGVGSRIRKKSVTRAPKHGGKKCPSLMKESKVCYHQGPCVGRGESSLCGGMSNTPSWKTYVDEDGDHGIYADISTASCAYDTTPGYVVQLVNTNQNAYFGFLSGTSSISLPHKHGFRFKIWYKKLSSKDLLQAAESNAWGISWLADSGSNSGITVAGKTGWRQDTSSVYSKKMLYADVETSQCGFTTQPYYFLTMHGDKNQWKLQGARNVYNSSLHKFRVYITYDKNIKPAMAEKFNWTVSWIGVSRQTPNNPPHAWTFGSIDRHWKKQGTKLGNVLYTEVKTGGPAFRMRPSYVVSMNMPARGYQMVGSSSVDRQTKEGFRFYLGKVGLEIDFSAEQQWEVNYLSWQVLDCKVSGWSDWSACSKTCSGGQQQRHRRILVPHGRGGTPCSKWQLQDARPCNEVQCVGVGSSNICGSTTAPKHTDWFVNMTNWKKFGNNGIYVDVDTSSCSFSTAPYYVVSVLGEQFHWQLTGANSVSRATATSLRVTVLHPNMKGLTLLRAAKQYNWRVNWLGEPGKNGGITMPRTSGWRQDTGGSDIASWTIYLDVETTACGFTSETLYPAPPRYFTALHGIRGVWRIRGSHIIYRPTRTGFRVYLVCDRPITTTKAEMWHWTIAWVGTSAKTSGSSGSNWQKVKDASGSVWVDRYDPPGVYLDVDTSGSRFSTTPTYITSITAPRGINQLWKVYGAASIYEPTPSTFRLYLAKAGQLKVLHKDKWIVNYIGVESNFCKVSAWSQWNYHCPCSEQKRSRSLQGSTSHCRTPLLLETKPCHCKTAAPSPGPNTDEYWKAMPTPAPKLSVRPTPSPAKTTEWVTDTVTLIGISATSFNDVAKLRFRKAVATTIGVAINDIIVVSIHAGSRRLQSAKQAPSSIIIFRVMCSTSFAARGVKEMLLARHFAHTLKIELVKDNIKPLSGSLSLRLSTPSISNTDPALKRGGYAKASPGSAAHLSKHASSVKMMLYTVLGAVGLAYVVLGACMYRKNMTKKFNKGGQMHEYEVEEEETRPLASGDRAAGIVAPESESGGVFI